MMVDLQVSCCISISVHAKLDSERLADTKNANLYVVVYVSAWQLLYALRTYSDYVWSQRSPPIQPEKSIATEKYRQYHILIANTNQSATVVTRGYESYRDCLKLALIVG